MGGCGKSQLALDFCQRAHAEGRFTAIFWIDASSPNTVAQSYTNIAQVISKVKVNPANSEANIHLVKNIISTRTTAWLLVFDNFDEPKAFSQNPLKGYFPQGNKGLIVLTSRYAESDRLGYSVSLSDMLEEEALELLFRSSKREKNDKNIAEGKKIVNRLGRLALAVDQAGAYIKGRIQFDAFLDHFKHRQEDVLRKTPAIWDYQRQRNEAEAKHLLSVATTWELSFDQIAKNFENESELKSKQHLLTLSAFFSSQNISEELFQNSYESYMPPWMATFVHEGTWDTYKYLDVVTELRNLYLIREYDSQTRGTSFSLHPLIQDWVKLRLDPQDRRAYATESMLLLFHYLDSQKIYTTLQTRRTVLSHLDAALENDRSYLCGGIRLGESSLKGAALRFAGVLSQHGRYREAERLYERVLEGNEKQPGVDSPETLKTVMYLAEIYVDLGKYEEAEQHYERVLKEREKQPGPEHLDTLGTMQNLAAVYAKQKRYEEAEQLFNKVLKEKEKQLGPENLITLTTVYNMATVYRNQRRYGDAKRLFGRVLKGREEQLGPENFSTIVTVYELALVCDDQAQYEDAERLYERALEQMEEQLGLENPHTVKIMVKLMESYVKQCRFEDAQRMDEKIPKIRNEREE
jgi:tetratricopeptide (TPR) repeat protein